MLKGRLGLETARVPHADRHGCLWLHHGGLYVEDGTLRFKTTGSGLLPAGDYAIPFQTVSCVLLGPGTTISHDCLRLLARHGTGLIAVGEDGVRYYASMPFGADSSALARRQIDLWSDVHGARIAVARRMYAWRLGEVLPATEIAVLRGIEGARVKTLYQRLAQQHGVAWTGRCYDRDDPDATDPVNQALNHASTAVRSAAMIAVAVTSTVPQLGFIHEDSALSFCLDIADLFREQVALPVAFQAVKRAGQRPDEPLERVARRLAGRTLHQMGVIPAMIDRIKALFEEKPDGDDRRGDAECS
ncbi:MAG: type I-E CRISPR-associated endonuclease Cas1 [Deltaproteobacteria bacterium]|nr:type I-E CRISPR-associated endonuclease Cas1 [Deltaproteobacteria bacterium]